MKTLLFFILVMIAACSHQSARYIASENPVLDDIFSIRTSTSPVFAEKLQEKVETALKLNGKTEFIEDPDLPLEKAFRVELDIHPQTKMMLMKVYYGHHSYQDKEAADALINFTRNITFTKAMPARYPYYEMYYNARHGHAPSLKKFILLKNSPDVNFPGRSNDYLNSPGFAERRAADEKLIPVLDAEIKKMKSSQKAVSASRKALMDQLDKLPEEQQLKQVIARGDRKGAAELIKKYLPWELMPPFEKKYWETYLDVMENPAPLEERVLIYRGLDDDFMHTATNLSKEEAVRESRAFYMSTVMVKNQGSWNRRLRSLESMYDKQINSTPEGKELGSNMRISNMFSNHAGEPLGSPFLSFSPDVKIAKEFGKNKTAAFLIDPRLLSYNFVGIADESEFLIALTTFPDDMVHLIDRSVLTSYVSSDVVTTKKIFDEKLAEKINAEYGVRGNEVYKKILKNSHNFFLNYFKPADAEAFLPDVTPGPSNLKFYNGLKEGAVKPLLGPTGNLNCIDVIRKFW